MSIDRVLPDLTLATRWTYDALRIPIHRKIATLEALGSPCLPTLVSWRGPQQLNPITCLALNYLFRIDIALSTMWWRGSSWFAASTA